MSTCSCLKQDRYANCCYRKKAEENVQVLRSVLENVKASIGDRLMAEGPLSDSYAHSVMKDIATALEQTRN